MTTFTVTIRMDNAAFDDSPMTELGRIMRRLADDINRGDFATDDMTLCDINGNAVGFARYNPKG